MPYSLFKSLLFLFLLSCSQGEEESQGGDGASESKVSDKTEDAAGSVGYAEMQLVIKDNCLSCHAEKASGGTGQKPFLETFDQVKENRKSIYETVSARRMPMGGGDFKVPEDRERLLNWLKDGKDFGGPMVLITLSSEITRLIPEQVSAKFKYNLGYTEGYHNKSLNRFIDTIMRNKGVALGGKDTKTLRDRNHSMRIQTLLSINSLSSKAAWSLVNEWNDEKEPRLFKVCRAHDCRPYLPEDDEKNEEKQAEARENAKLWEEQLVDIFYKFYARKPSEQEVSFLKEKFIKIYNTEKEADPDAWWGVLARSAWAILIYGMMQTVEFWHY